MTRVEQNVQFVFPPNDVYFNSKDIKAVQSRDLYVLTLRVKSLNYLEIYIAAFKTN